MIIYNVSDWIAIFGINASVLRLASWRLENEDFESSEKVMISGRHEGIKRGSMCVECFEFFQ